jgi:hypothetical protein
MSRRAASAIVGAVCGHHLARSFRGLRGCVRD